MGALDNFLSGGLGSLAGGLFGSIGSIWQNNTNLKIARETNAMNRQMFDDQLAYNTEMWNKQNEYNDPLAQRQRLENAGLNPLFFGLDGTGNASGWQTSTPIPAQGASVVNPLSALGQGVADMINQQKTASEKKLTDEYTTNEQVFRSGRLKQQYVDITLGEATTSYTKEQEHQLGVSARQMDEQLRIANGHLLNEEKRTAIQERLADIEQFKADIYNEDVISKIKERDANVRHLSKQDWALGQQMAIAWRHVAIDQQNANTNSRMADIAQQNSDIAQQNADIAQQNADTASAAQASQAAVNESIIKVNGQEYEFKKVMTEKGIAEIKLVDAQTGLVVEQKETEKIKQKNLNAERDLIQMKTVNEGLKAMNSFLDFIIPEIF